MVLTVVCSAKKCIGTHCSLIFVTTPNAPRPHLASANKSGFCVSLSTSLPLAGVMISISTTWSSMGGMRAPVPWHPAWVMPPTCWSRIDATFCIVRPYSRSVCSKSPTMMPASTVTCMVFLSTSRILSNSAIVMSASFSFSSSTLCASTALAFPEKPSPLGDTPAPMHRSFFFFLECSLRSFSISSVVSGT